MYLLSETQIRDLARSKLKPKDVINPENKALVTWSGEDVKQYIEKEGKTTLSGKLDWAVDQVSHILENCNCFECVAIAIDDL